jgi:regulator of protease activity HflC (stomatin/prohibitin superfamily)
MDFLSIIYTNLLVLAIVLSGIIVVSILLSYVYLVRQAEVIIIERLGRFNRILGPGFHLTIPFLETPRRVIWSHVKEMEGKRYYRFTKVLERIDLREAVYDFPKQNVITKDNVTTEINAFVYYQITDAHAAVYGVYDLPEAIEKLAQTTLRNVIGSMDLDETLVSRDQINARLRTTLDEAADKWGVKVTRVELQEVNPPSDIRHAMEKQMRAERDRRAVILEAEGAKQSAILRSEGDQEARVREARGIAEAKVIIAEGEADARLRTAHAEAQALELLARALPQQDPAAYLIALQYVRVLPQLTEGKDSKLVVVPYETAGLMGSLSGMKRIFDQV